MPMIVKADVIVVLTWRPVERLLEDGGSEAWVINPSNAQQCTYVVCTRNRKHKGADQQVEHGAAFFVGKISRIEECEKEKDEETTRYRIRCSAYALLDPQPIVWPGYRYPIWYADSLQKLKIDEASLEWHPMPNVAHVKVTAQSLSSVIEESRQRIAVAAGVRRDAVEISVRF